jgi:putative exporter of polyketide antibiotics
MISSAMGSAAVAAPAGSLGVPMVPALVGAGPVFAEIGWVLVAFVAVFLGTLLGIALGEYEPPKSVPRRRQVSLTCAAPPAAASMTPAA